MRLRNRARLWRGYSVKAKKKPMLVRKGDRWQVCYQTIVTIEGKSESVWLYGPPAMIFCRSDEAEQWEELPLPFRVNFFGDRYVHVIEQIGIDGRREISLGGCNDPHAAQVAFDCLLDNTQPDRKLILREGGRIMREEFGRAVFCESIQRWVSPCLFESMRRR